MRPAKLLVAATVADTITGFLLPFADHFRSLGWIVDGMAAGIHQDSIAAAHFDQTWEIGWSRRPRDPANLEAIARVRRVATEREYDIVHVHTPIASFVTRLALRDLRRTRGLKVAYTAHGFHSHPGGRPLSNTLFCGIEKLAGRWTDALVVINGEDERLARRHGLGGRGRIYYMPGIGIDLAQYSRAKVAPDAIEAVKREMGVGSSDRIFLMVADFAPGKRHVDAVRAFSLMREPGLHLAFAGVGPETDRVAGLVLQLGLTESVHFLGNRSDVPVLLAASIALLLPSAREGLPRSILEAMGMGTPAIGTRVRGIHELLGGGAGLLVGVGDVEGLAGAMRVVAHEPEHARLMACRAQKRSRRYALPRIVTLHQEMYGELLDTKPHRASVHP